MQLVSFGLDCHQLRCLATHTDRLTYRDTQTDIHRDIHMDRHTHSISFGLDCHQLRRLATHTDRLTDRHIHYYTGTYTQTDIHRDRDSNSLPHTQTDSQTDIYIDTHTDRHIVTNSHSYPHTQHCWLFTLVKLPKSYKSLKKPITASFPGNLSKPAPER